MLKYIATKFKVNLNESQLAYLGADCLGGPRVCITKTGGHKLVLLSGANFLNFKNRFMSESPSDIALRYSEKEWSAFLKGAKDEEFDGLIDSDPEDNYLIRDSKDPEGPVLVFNRLQIKSFIKAVKKGKYDL